MFSRFLIGVFFFGFSVLSWGAVEHFFPDHGSFLPGAFPGQKGRELGYLFQNPAGLGTAKQGQLGVESGTSYLGYSPLTISYVHVLPYITLGFGLFSFESHDAFSVADTSDRPSSQGALAHNFRQYRLAFSGKFKKNEPFQWGGVLTSSQEELAGKMGTSQSLDVGALWRDPLGWELGVRTQNLFSSYFQWEGATDSLSPQVFVQGGFHWDESLASIEYGADRYHTVLEWAIHPSFSLLGDASMTSSLGLLRYGYGTILSLDPVRLQYLHLVGTNVDLGVDQDLFAVMLVF